LYSFNRNWAQFDSRRRQHHSACSKFENSGSPELRVGNFDLVQMRLVGNAELTDTAAVRVGLHSEQRDGYLSTRGFLRPDSASKARPPYETVRLVCHHVFGAPEA
jgi:hypothetical protein